jgi:hypothetical protein
MEVGVRKTLHGLAAGTLPAGVSIVPLLAPQVLRVGQSQQKSPIAWMAHQQLGVRQTLLRMLPHEELLDLLLTYDIRKAHCEPLGLYGNIGLYILEGAHSSPLVGLHKLQSCCGHALALMRIAH